MYYTERMRKDGQDDVQAMRKHEREESLLMLISEVSDLLNTADGERLVWHSTFVDLLEALHTAYIFGDLCDEEGQPCSFKEMVRRACRLFGRRVPHNPTAMATRAVNRKGVKQRSFFDRYCMIRRRNHGDRPLSALVSKAP